MKWKRSSPRPSPSRPPRLRQLAPLMSPSSTPFFRRTPGESTTASRIWHISKPRQVSLPVPTHSDRNRLGIQQSGNLQHSMEQRRQDNKVNKLIKDIKYPLAILALHHKQTLNCSSDRRVGLRQLRRHLRRYQDWYFRRRLHASRPLFVNLDEWFLVAFQEVKLEMNCFEE